MANENEDKVILLDDEGNEEVYEVLDMFEMDNGNVYGVFYPDGEEESDEVFIYRIVADQDDNEQIEAIEDDEELMAAFEMFKQRGEEDFEFDD